jgi:hypothetical protein
MIGACRVLVPGARVSGAALRVTGDPYHLFHNPYLTIALALTILVCVTAPTSAPLP